MSLALTLICTAASIPAFGQDLTFDFKLLYEIEGENKGDRFGAGLWAVGDVDQDGATDFLATAITSTGKFRYARIYSGHDGRELYELPYQPKNQMDSTFASANWIVDFSPLGDLDADGVPDLGAGDAQGEQDQFHIFSGRSGQILRSYNEAHQIRALGDLDQDGINDYVVDRNEAQGTSTIYSGSTGDVLFVLSGNDGFVRSGGIRNAGDLNGDGADDLAFVARTYTADTLLVSGIIRGRSVFHAIPTSHILGRYSPEVSGDITTISSLDLGRDEFPELLFSYHPEGDDHYNVAFSPKSQTELWRKKRLVTAWSFLIDDLNEDGSPEILSPSSFSPWSVISGKSGEELMSLDEVEGISLRQEVAALSDLDGDGFRELVLHDRAWKTKTGRVLVYSMFGGNSEPYRPGNPQLTVNPTTNAVTIAWPATLQNPRPEWSTDLQTWNPVFDGAAPKSGRYVLPGIEAEPQRYFRLRYEE